MSWNVGGSMRHLHSDVRLLRYLARHDLVGLVHTGSDRADTPMGDMECVHVAQRPVGTASGGVAVFASRAFKPRVSFVREHAMLGIVWVRVDLPAGAEGDPTFVAVCYLPPAGSPFYRGGHGHTMQEHWEALNADVAELSPRGSVMIMGDLNAHTAEEPDICGLVDDGAHTGVAPSAAAVELRAMQASMPQRRSSDARRAVGPMGRQLLTICQQHSMVILNGRLPGDTPGEYTFRQRGVGGGRGARAELGCSVVDYLVASPRLAFARTGAVLPGCSMRIPRACFDRPGSGSYDHAPVSGMIRWYVRRTAAPRAPAPQDGEPLARWKWRPELERHYVPLLNSASVQGAWQEVRDDSDASSAVDAVMRGLEAAVAGLHALCGRVIVRGGGNGPPRHRPVNGWYDGECAGARRTLRAAEREHGAGSPQASAARRCYKRQVDAAKGRHERKASHALQGSLYSDPKAFWRSVQTARGAPPPGGVDEWTRYFASLFRSNHQGRYHANDFEAHCAHHAPLFPSASLGALAAAEGLNAPFTESELQAGIAELASHKSAGPDGMVAEFIRHAAVDRVGLEGKSVRFYMMGPVLTRAFNCILRGSYPSGRWGVSALVPVPKAKGQRDCKDDYRGIAVSPVLAKLFSLVFLRRLDRWAEEGGWRAVGQAGFRARRGTPDNCFVLRHVVDAAKARRAPVYAAFIDFSKAYDRVDRRLLWRCLQGMGVHGAALGVLQGMYADVRLRVRVGQALGASFESDVGVRQGDPLSPLLFGLFIDRLEGWLAERCPGLGARLAGRVLQALFYADDVVLLADSPGELQALLDALHLFCGANDMTVNMGKSKVVVFHPEHAAGGAGGRAGGEPTFTLGGSPVSIRTSYTYLGLDFGGDNRPGALGARGRGGRDGWAAAALADRVVRGRKVMFALLGQCCKTGVRNVNLQLHLFDSLVRSVLCFGCEVWGPDAAAAGCASGDFTGAGGRAEVEVHLPFLRRCLGVSRSTTVCAMLRELNREPLAMFWMRMAAQLWNRALEREGGDWLRLALEENVRVALGDGGEGARRTLWSHHFLKGLRALGISPAPAGGVLQKVDLGVLRRGMQERWERVEWDTVSSLGHDQPWSRAPCSVRAAPNDFRRGFKKLVYQRWFGPEAWARRESWTFHLHGAEQIKAVARFRLGDHWLGIQRQRFEGVPRSDRRCPRCPGCVEDEMHVFECPLYEGARGRLAAAFEPSDAWMRAATWPKTEGGWRALGDFLVACKRTREEAAD
jgi:hypothetical protein